jgi:hypothetical protein
MEKQTDRNRLALQTDVDAEAIGALLQAPVNSLQQTDADSEEVGAPLHGDGNYQAGIGFLYREVEIRQQLGLLLKSTGAFKQI